MKSLRLNKDLRATILSSFVEKYLTANPTPEKLFSDPAKRLLADKLWECVYGKVDTSRVPSEYLNRKNYITVQLPNGSVDHLYYSKDDKGNSTLRLSTNESKVELVIDESMVEWKEYQQTLVNIKERNAVYDEHQKALKKFKTEVSQVLESVNTTGQLLEVWPEAAPFVPQEISNPSSINLPAVSFAELNKVLS